MENLNQKWSKNRYFRGFSVKRIALFVAVYFITLIVISEIKAEDNKTIKKMPMPGISSLSDMWPTQLIYDSVHACYQGTIRWVITANPSLAGVAPSALVQREMIIHCHCVLDKIRVDYDLQEYLKRVFDLPFVSDLYMTKALECVNDRKTLKGIIILQKPNDNETIIPDESQGLKEELQEPKQEEPKSEPETIFRG